MSMDQICAFLCDKEMLKKPVGERTGVIGSADVMNSMTSQDGTVKGRTAEGIPIVGRVKGKSKARQLMEEAVAATNRKN